MFLLNSSKDLAVKANNSFPHRKELVFISQQASHPSEINYHM